MGPIIGPIWWLFCGLFGKKGIPGFQYVTDDRPLSIWPIMVKAWLGAGALEVVRSNISGYGVTTTVFLFPLILYFLFFEWSLFPHFVVLSLIDMLLDKFLIWFKFLMCVEFILFIMNYCTVWTLYFSPLGWSTLFCSVSWHSFQLSLFRDISLMWLHGRCLKEQD